MPYRESGSAGQPCPACRNEGLRSRSLGPARAAYCDHCKGLWMETGEFEGLVSAPETLHRAAEGLGQTRFPDRVRYRPCPECEEFMARENFAEVSGVVIDRCSLHGVWLEAGELAAIDRFLQDGEIGVVTAEYEFAVQSLRSLGKKTKWDHLLGFLNRKVKGTR